MSAARLRINSQNGIYVKRKSPKTGNDARRRLGNKFEMRNNLKQLRKDAGLSQEQTARAFGLSKGGYVKIEDGDRRLTAEYIDKAAKVFGVPPSAVIESEPRRVPIVGYVGAGGETFFGNSQGPIAEAHARGGQLLELREGQGPLGEVEAPDGATEDTVAVEIRGAPLGELFDKWLLFYDETREFSPPELINRLCVVGLSDGRVLVKKLKRERPKGGYDLFSNTEPPIYDAIIAWAAPVKSMIPR